MNAERYTTYKLEFPVEYGGSVINELKIRRPQGKHLMDFPLMDINTSRPLLELAAELSGQPPQLFSIMEGEDIGRVLNLVSDFLSVIAKASKPGQES